MRLGQSLLLVGHVCHALWISVAERSFQLLNLAEMID
jgi:hypothetical protein